jgi:hypothetical protein
MKQENEYFYLEVFFVLRDVFEFVHVSASDEGGVVGAGEQS